MLGLLLRLGLLLGFLGTGVQALGCGQANDAADRKGSKGAKRDAGTAPPAPLPPPPPPSTPPIDLLRAVRADLAVSSVFRNSVNLVGHLVDGNTKTAWKSRSDDLVGAWIEVRLPKTSTVTSIGMTSGCAKPGGGPTESFANHHRIGKVRVLRDGKEVSFFELDPGSRDLQTLDVKGPGGVYRIQILSVVPGSKPTWREVCISELRFFGHDPKAREGTRFPRLAVGALPAPRREPGSFGRSEVGPRFRQELQWFKSSWRRFERDVQLIDMRAEDAPPSAEVAVSLTRARRTLLSRVADVTERVDEVRADQLRFAAVGEVDWSDLEERERVAREDLDRIASALGAVASWLNDNESACAWRKADISVRLGRIAERLETQRHRDDVTVAHADEPLTREAETNRTAVQKNVSVFDGLARTWSTNPSATAERLRTLTLPSVPSVAPDWEVIRSHLDAGRAACGWGK